MTSNKAMWELYNRVRDMQPGQDFDCLVEQLVLGNFLQKKYGYIVIESNTSTYFVPDFSNDTNMAGALIHSLPKNIHVSQSMMRWNEKESHTCIIDDTDRPEKDVIYIEVTEKIAAFAFSKAILLWKIKDLIQQNKEVNPDLMWIERE